MGSRGQTETLGFVLVFALITASIGLVYASGFAGLDDARGFEQVNNAERAFEVFADNVEDLVHWNAPSRSTEIKLAGASLSVAEPIDVRVNASGSGLNETTTIQPVIYDADTGERIIYVQGAIIRESGDGAVVVQESSMLISENRTVVPLIQTRGKGSRSVAGSTTVLIRTSQATSTLIYVDDAPPTPIWLNITSSWTDAWIDHLEAKSGVSDCLAVGDTAACRIDTGRVSITKVQIDVEIED